MHWECILQRFLFILFAITATRTSSISKYLKHIKPRFDYIFRREWKARPATRETGNLTLPVQYVIFHHTVKPDIVNYTDLLIMGFRKIQKYYQEVKNLDDIPYNFIIGGDCLAYEGRGYKKVGQHTPGYDNISLGIAMMGDYTDKNPYECMMKAASDLVNWGVKKLFVERSYKIYAHCQLAENTSCPGDTFFEKMQEWDEWSSNPPDLDYMNQFIL